MVNESPGSTSPTDIASARRSPHSASHRVARALWSIAQATVFRFSPRPFHGWRRFLLRVCGAHLASTSRVYPRARIWAPWNLTMLEDSTIADDVEVYSVASIRIGARSTVSQFSHLCAATHDFEDPAFPLRPAPIEIGDDCWLAAEVFVGPGVTIGNGTVVGARASVFDDLPGWSLCVGTPAKPKRPRVMRPASTA